MILFVLSLLAGSLGFILLWRLPICSEDASEASSLRLTVIIPARNEEANLPRLLESLTPNAALHEVIVVDDASIDQTAAIARSHGANVLTGAPLPEGWGGKTWACQQGAEAATGDTLLFLDADTWLMPQGLARLINDFAAGGGVLSVGPYHNVSKPYEQLSAFFNLIMTMGTGDFAALRSKESPKGLFGQMLMVRRDDYFAVGGHASVKNRNLENFCLAELFRAHGIRLRCLGGKGTLHFRMYPNGLRELIDGWTKGFAAGASQTPRWILFASIFWLSALITSPAHLIASFVQDQMAWDFAWLGLYLAFAAQLYFLLRQIGSFHPLTALVYPISLIFYFLVFTRSLFRQKLPGKAQWKGRIFDAR